MPLPTIQSTYTLVWLGLFFFCSSFSAVPVEKNKTAAHQQQHWQKKEQQLKKRLQLLQTKAKHPKKQQQLQKRLKRIQQQKQGKNISSFLLGLLSMIGGIVSAAFWVTAVVSSFALAFNPAGFTIVAVLVALTLLFALTGLILGITYLHRRRKHPEDHDKPGFAIAGIIISSIFLLLGMVLVIGASMS